MTSLFSPNISLSAKMTMFNIVCLLLFIKTMIWNMSSYNWTIHKITSFQMELLTLWFIKKRAVDYPFSPEIVSLYSSISEHIHASTIFVLITFLFSTFSQSRFLQPCPNSPPFLLNKTVRDF